MQSFRKFIPITKIDVAKREVYGVVTSEAVDKDGEICDYDSTAPYYRAWSAEIEKATEGKSLGNVREMHANKAAGKVVALEYDDAAKRIVVAAKIVDDDAWEKCQEGVYTGFSQGGEYVKVWQDGQHHRYTARPSEISLVDNPCNPEAHFEYVKGDGSVEVRKFLSAQAVGALSELARAVRRKSPVVEQEPGCPILPAKPEGGEVADSGAAVSTVTKYPQGSTRKEKTAMPDANEQETKFPAETRDVLDQMRAAHEALGQCHESMKGHHQTLAELHQEMGEHHAEMEDCFGKLLDGAVDGDRDGDSDEEDKDGDAEKTARAARAQAAGAKSAAAKLAQLTTAKETLQADLQKATGALKRANEQLAKLLAEPKPPKAAAKAVTKDEDTAGHRLSPMTGAPSPEGDRNVLKACLAQPFSA